MTKPQINLHNQDCMKAMAAMGDNAYDLAIVDPPYGIGNFTSQNLKATRKKYSAPVKWNEDIPETGYFQELIRVSKKQIIWGANYYNFFNGKGGALVWYKGDFAKNMSQCEIASLNFKVSTDFIHINWQPGFYRKSIEKIIHQCQKPIALYKWLLKNYASEGDRILDTHLGSGSIAIACHDLGFNLEGYEIDQEYHQAALERVNTHRSQLQIF